MTNPLFHAFHRRCHGSVSFGYTLDLDHLSPFANNLRQVKQVHGAMIYNDDTYREETQEGDGLATAHKRTALIIKTADCLPVLASDGIRVVAVHAGWRGLKAGIVKKMANFVNTNQARVYIGPAIATANYEVDQDLYTPWLAEEPALANHLIPAPAGGTKRLLDTKSIAVRHLIETGFLPQQIEVSPMCTYNSGLPSWRREQPDKRRLYSFIYLD